MDKIESTASGEDQRIIIAGGSGFIGRELSAFLQGRGYQVVVLSRKQKGRSSEPKIRFVSWDGKSIGPWQSELEGARAVINLAGKSVNCLPTAKNLREILESRVNSVKVLSQAFLACKQPPTVMIQASSLAIYGNPGDVLVDESSPHGKDYHVRVCEEWESEVVNGNFCRARKVILRIGFALGTSGGALTTLSRLTKVFLGGTVGSGKQFISWIHIRDLCEMFLWAIEREDIRGAYNATGLTPVPNKEFMRELRKAHGRPWVPPAPEWLVRFGSKLFLRTDPDLALTGRRCFPRRFSGQGFEFQYADLRTALADLI